MRKKRLLIVGCGDVLTRALPWLTRRFKVYALCRHAVRAAELRACGVTPILADLDHPRTLARLSGLGEYILLSAPPPNQGIGDPRSQHLAATLAKAAILPRRLCYISTSGVYGDCGGALIDETRPLQPESERARRRVAAEHLWRDFGRRHRTGTVILRAPGIYADNRLPVARLQAGTPALRAEDDGYSNHIHADDLARACGLALFRTSGGRVHHVVDDCMWTMGEWFDRVADAAGLPRPPRLDRDTLRAQVSPMLWSFMRESRRLRNTRMKQELRLRLQHPTPERVLGGLAGEATDATTGAVRAPAGQ
ncbi:SDR family oxidoreductase [Chitinimonas sp. BJYL2]|uniref:SDR family oxidoreductase n=1 Tax=Chitinimonas sp. BJYL2 TaxID=2976696 RepID=UPI0022B47CDE|nr:SDR family oxidoreductase [Chitinimonas sp. BJYL2]